jgi:DNA polymerase I-like protein with 3'-5' exonuclease and polymerase domains/uracil-DNA glycosylase
MKSPDLLVLIDNPTYQSLKQNTMLSGMESTLLKACLASVGFNLEDVQYLHVVDKPTLHEKHVGALVKEYGEDLIRRVNEINPKRILGLGVYAHSLLIDRMHEKPGNKLPIIKKVRGAMHMYENAEGIEIPMVSTVHPYMCLEEEAYWVRDFSKDITKLASQDKRQKFPHIKMAVCDSVHALKPALRKLASYSIVSVDVETTGFHHMQDTIQAFGLGACNADGSEAYTVVISRKLLATKDFEELVATRRMIYEFLSGMSYPGVIVMHNGKFDLKFINRWLKGHQPLYNPKIRDTLLLNYLLDERPLNDATAPHGLKRIARERFDATDYAIDFDTFWDGPDETRDWHTLHLYLSMDLYYTARLYREQVKELKQYAPEAIKAYNQILCPVSSALSIIESEGIPADPEAFKNLEVTFQKELNQIRSALQVLVNEVIHGEAVLEYPTKEFNPQSSVQVNNFLYDICQIPMVERKRTSGADALDKLIHLHRTKLSNKTMRFIELIKDYSKISKVVSTYARPLAERAAMGVVYAQFNPAGAATGRWSSQDPNMQNMPNMAGDDIRRCFIAPEGYVWAKLDYSQLELRTTAELSGDPQMLRAFEEGRDIHSEVASAMFGVRPEDVSKAQRFAAKFVDFGIVYGRSAKGIAEGKELREYNWSVRDAQRFVDNFLRQFKTLARWMRSVQREAVENQELMTPTGRRRRWPLMSPEIKSRVERQAVNFPVQSLAADITAFSMVKIFEWLRSRPELRARIVAVVHDEIDIVIHHEDLDEVVQNALRIMETQSPVPLKVKLKAEAEVGRNWTDLTEWFEGITFDYIKEKLPL